MKAFAKLISNLEQTSKEAFKVTALAQYFSNATDEDKLWTLALFTGTRPKRVVDIKALKEFAEQVYTEGEWLFEASHQIVGDMAETIAYFLPKAKRNGNHTLSEWISMIRTIFNAERIDQRDAITKAWDTLRPEERFIFNKLITGGFRIDVSLKLLSKALAIVTGKDENLLAHKLNSDWHPDEVSFETLIFTENPEAEKSKPYPFHLAHTLESTVAELGDISNWQVERKWDGIRVQVIVRGNKISIWSRKGDILSSKVPELKPLAESMEDGTVLDGELICFKNGKILPINNLRTRFGRRNNSKKQFEESPCVFMAYDILEFKGEDIRNKDLAERRKKLEKVILQYYDEHKIILLSDIINNDNWESINSEREKSREHQVTGLVLKNKKSIYGSSRVEGDWWKWPVDPLFIDAILLYAQAGEGGSSKMYREYSFALWHGEDLVTFAKAKSGLEDKELKELTSFVKKNTKEKFGPVRSVAAVQIFRLAFDSITASKRHKSGILLKNPRLIEWLRDKNIEDGNNLDDLKKML